MANYSTVFTFLISLEDATGTGEVTNDTGGETRFGIGSRWYPQFLTNGFYTCQASQALAMAQEFYQTTFWNPIQGDGIFYDKVAAQLLSIGVNAGTGTAVKMAQQVANVEMDGLMGPQTLAAINAIDENTFISSFNAAAISHYQQIAQNNPAEAEYLTGWINRVNAINNFQE